MMKYDARTIINKKKWKGVSSSSSSGNWNQGKTTSRSLIDARKILEKKRTLTSPRYKKSNIALNRLVKKELSDLLLKPGKNVKLSQDGNIWITSKSSDKKPPSSVEVTILQNKPLQGPSLGASSSVEMDDLEHISINDVIDMDSLPPALVSPGTSSPSPSVSVPSQTSLAHQVLNMQNTMVADQEMTAESNVRVYVTNLGPSVSKQDVMELFGDVGFIKAAKMLQPGTAVIEYYSAEDARKACDIYHNRLLDGQPMHCFMKHSTPPQRLSISERLGDKVVSYPSSPSPVVSSAPISSRSRLNPRNVQFTVKL